MYSHAIYIKMMLIYLSYDCKCTKNISTEGNFLNTVQFTNYYQIKQNQVKIILSTSKSNYFQSFAMLHS